VVLHFRRSEKLVGMGCWVGLESGGCEIVWEGKEDLGGGGDCLFTCIYVSVHARVLIFLS
jgi:hypothetical protein